MEIETRQELDKTVGIVAYMTLIGWIIALVMNGEKKGEEKSFGAFHLRQMLGLIIFGFGSGIVYAVLAMILIFIPVVGWIVLVLVQLGLFGGLLALWIMGVIAASNGEKKQIPIIGGMIHKMLGTTFE
jgi:uncharacterized membrane protein